MRLSAEALPPEECERAEAAEWELGATIVFTELALTVGAVVRWSKAGAKERAGDGSDGVLVAAGDASVG